jgi:hypothetical protein
MAEEDPRSAGLNPRLVDLINTERQRLRSVRPPAGPPFVRPLAKRLTPVTEAAAVQGDLAPIEHVVLELRRMAFQVSPSAVLCVLSNAWYWLTNALTADGHVVGANEIFQFFVFALCRSDIRYLPALVSFVDRFVDRGLKDTRFGYLLTQLTSALDFIRQRVLPINPFLVLPFKTVSQRLRGKMTWVGSVVMRSLAVFAFPSFTPDIDRLFPAMLRLAGVEDNVAVCHQFQMASTVGLFPDDIPELDTCPTVHETFFLLSATLITRYNMILVDSGDFERNADGVQFMSALMKPGAPVTKPRLAELDKLCEAVRWRFHFIGPYHAINVRAAIAEVQRALAIAGKKIALDGVMSSETAAAIAEFCGVAPDVTFTPEMFDQILTSVASDRNVQRVKGADWRRSETWLSKCLQR